MQIVLTDSSDEINPFAVENQIQEKQKALVTYGVAEKKILDFFSKFKEMDEEIKALQQVLEGYKSKRQAVTSLDRQMDDLCETLGKTILDVTEYDDRNIRQLIDAIKVMGEDKLLIVFKGGLEMVQAM